MDLAEFMERLTQYKQNLDVERLREEDRKITETIEELEKSKQSLKESLKKLRTLEKKINELNKYEDKLEEVKADIEKLTKLNSAEEIIRYIDKIKSKVDSLEKDIEQDLNKIIEEKIKSIEEINNRLILYAKILYHFLKIQKDAKTFSIPKERSLSKLNEVEIQAKQHLNELYGIIVDELRKINLNEKEISILILLIDKGEIKISRDNLEESIKVIKMLVEKNISIKVKV
ncbi:hypothetical protein SULI_00080 [Saccharolobus solfataricus]|uniref:Uncharacterized protein n=2 Tax=Saccharolobus solfataricus TaxID=2287 RepID=A0A0E3GSQ3_SACSO|nr:hypothetical protein [Saccharolobus solfataricus]AKA72471.1 hypothetical protein SULB_0016 [Saccharolobus solfataricus]AKA75171.1 hypothetical protein SULC_0015 [Saccharolobus solfataricus]AKA77864.1 hypothetical protein SULA_0015 [Saccharolobus solfataricus]AZF66985.1 hypothetical protein SULG_00080 [Saccharolobus solfataricus]AZF69605.1 hypothetical protein SULH_00080 [Saccharolobus solfataricus]